MKLNKFIYKNISNIITIIGLLIVNYSLIMYNLTNNSIYLIYLIIGLLCDYLDGYFSRKLKIESKIGNFLDKIVDKINQSFILITIINKYNESIWYFLLFILREIVMLFLRYSNFKSTKSSIYGKIKTFIFPLSILLYHKNSIFKKIFLNFLTITNFITLII